jgi:hypothetical protein
MRRPNAPQGSGVRGRRARLSSGEDMDGPASLRPIVRLDRAEIAFTVYVVTVLTPQLLDRLDYNVL